MNHWTASINLYEHDEQLRYSVCWWRVNDARRSFTRPAKRVTGTVPAPYTKDPEDWLRAVLGRLLAR